MELTATRVRKLLHYDAATGTLTWTISPRYGIRAGDEAGCSASGNYGYRRVRIDAGLYLVHRIVWVWMTGKWPKHQIGHINLDKAENLEQPSEDDKSPKPDEHPPQVQ